ncbi:hypothetical protein ACH494_34205, partial [Micromonospora fulviviridis]
MGQAPVPSVGLNEPAKQALENFTGMRLHRSNLPMLAYDLNWLEVLADRARTVLVPELIRAIKAVRAAGEGEVYDRFVAQTAPFVELLDRVADLKVNTAQAMRGFLNQMELTDRQALVMFIFMMTELAVAFAMAFFLPVEAAAHIVKTRTIIQTILRSSIMRSAASSTAIQMLFMPGSSLLAQISMLADGLMPGIDWAQVGKQALYGLAVAGVTTAAAPALGRFAGAVGGGLAHLGVSGSTRDLLTSLMMVPVSEVGMEVVGGAAAGLMVDGAYDTDSADTDAASGALSGAGELAGTAAGMGARRGAVGLGFNPTRPRWRMPDGVGFTADGRPVAPVPPPIPVTEDPSAYQPEVGDPAGAGSGGPAPVPVPPVPAPSLSAPAPVAPEPVPPVPAWSAPTLSAPAWSVPDLPVPSWSVPDVPVPPVPAPEWVVAAGAPVVEQWQQFQRELVDHYGGVLAGTGQARQFLAGLPVPVEQVFTEWADARQNDPTVPAFLSRIGLPATALTEGYLFGVRDQAVARITEALAGQIPAGGQIPAAVRPEQVVAALPAEFDRQALRSAVHLAAQHHIDQYLTTDTPTPVTLQGGLVLPGAVQVPGAGGVPGGAAVPAVVGTPGAAGVPGGAGVPGAAGAAAVPSDAVRAAVARHVDRSLDAILGTNPLPTGPLTMPSTVPSAVPSAAVAGPDAAQVNAVADVVRQVVTDLPARFTAAVIPDATAPEATPAGTDTPAHGRTDVPTVPVTPEQHTAAAASLAETQFTALARKHGVELTSHDTLAESFRQDWVDGYHQVLAQATAAPGTAGMPSAPATSSTPGVPATSSTPGVPATSSTPGAPATPSMAGAPGAPSTAGAPGTPGTPDAAGVRSTVPGGVASRIDGTPDHHDASDHTSASELSVPSDGIFSRDSSFTDTTAVSDPSSQDGRIDRDEIMTVSDLSSWDGRIDRDEIMTVSDLSSQDARIDRDEIMTVGDLSSQDGRADRDEIMTVGDLSSQDGRIDRDEIMTVSDLSSWDGRADRDEIMTVSDLSSLDEPVGGDPGGRGEPASAAPEPAVAATGQPVAAMGQPVEAAESARRVADWVDQTPVGPDNSRDPWWWCVQATLDAYTTAYGRPGKRAVFDDRILGPDGRPAPTTTWPQLLDILGATDESVAHPGGVRSEDVLAALRAAPGSMVVVRVAPPNEPQHVFALHSQPQPSGPPTIKVRDGLVPGAEDRPEPTDPELDPWFGHLFASSTRLAAFDSTGRPTAIADLLPDRTTAHPQPTTTASIDPSAILLASTTPPRGPSQAMQTDSASSEPSSSLWQPSAPAEMDDAPGAGPASVEQGFHNPNPDLSGLDLSTPAPKIEPGWEPAWDVDPVESDLSSGGESPASDMDGGTPRGAEPVDPSDPLAEMDDAPGTGPASVEQVFHNPDLSGLDLSTPAPKIEPGWEPAWDVDPVESDLSSGGESPASDMDGETPRGAEPVDPSDPLASESGADWLADADLNNSWEPIEDFAGVDWPAESGQADYWEPLALVDSPAPVPDVDRLAEPEQVESDVPAGVDSPTSEDGEPPAGTGPVDSGSPWAEIPMPASVAGTPWLADADPRRAVHLLAVWDQQDLARDVGTLPENPAPIGPDPGPSEAPAVGGAGGVPQDWKRTVASAIAQLSAVGTRGEAGGVRDVAAEFAQWTRDVLEVDLSADRPKPDDFYRAVLGRFENELKKAGVDRSVPGLRAWVARELAADLRRGGESEFSGLLPYPEVMSERRREDLHRQWLNKIALHQSGDFDVAHVVPHVIASRLSLPMRIHHLFGAPHDIGPEPRAGIRYPVVFHKGVYYLGQLPDPADVERARRIADGFARTEVSEDEQRRLDRLFDDAGDLLRAKIAEAENNPHPTNSDRWPVLRETFHRQLAVIRQHPDSPHNKKAQELAGHVHHLQGLLTAGRWESGSRQNLENQFTIHLPVSFDASSRGYRYLHIWLANRQSTSVEVDRMAVPGDWIAVHFGKVGGVGTGFVEVSYTSADGTEVHSRREIGRSLNDSELARLRSRAVGKVWDVDRPPLVRDFYTTTPVQPNGELSVRLGQADGGPVVLRPRISQVPVVGGLPPVLTRELKETRLLLGYARDGGRPTAILEAPAGKNVKGQPLYLEVSRPAATRSDVERLRKKALWEPNNRWALSEQMSFDVVLQQGADPSGALSIRAASGPLSIEVGVSGRGRTLDGAVVDLSPGTSVTVSVGKWPGQGEDETGVAGTIPVVVGAPLVDGSGHVYRLFDTGVDNERFDDLTSEISAAPPEVREVPRRTQVPAVGRSGGVPRGWKRTVASAIEQLSAVGTRGEAGGVRDVAAEFAQWTGDVLGVDLPADLPKPNDFYDAVLDRFDEKLKAAGVDRSVSGLRAWVARELAADLRRGGESEFSGLLPYPEVMSEQRRQDLHRQWLNKIANHKSGHDDVAHVVPRVIASRLSLPMRIHYPFGAPQDIGPKPGRGDIPHPVVFHKGAYYLGQLPDPADVERAHRIAEGFPRTEVSEDEQRRLDRLFVDARDLLRAKIAEAENNPHPTNSKHWPVLRETLQRELAVIRREHPDYPHNRKAQELELLAYRRYFDDLRADPRWEEETTDFSRQFTLDFGVRRPGDGKALELSVPLDGRTVSLAIGRVAMRGDRLPVHFGKRGEEGIAFAEFRYTDATDGTDGTDRILYQELGRRFSGDELRELRVKAAGRVWDLHHRPLSNDHYQVTVPLLGGGIFGGIYGDPAAPWNDRRITVPHVPVVGGLPPVLYAELNGRLILSYAEDGRPTAIVVAPAEKNVTGLPLYLELGKPALVVDDIKRLRKDALWEPEDRWALSERMSFEVLLEQGKWTSGPLPIAVGGPDSARTLAGAEVDLSPGTSVTLSVGQWQGRVGADVAGTIPVVVRAPLVDGSGHVYRLLDTGVDNERFDDLRRDITEALTKPGSVAAMLGERPDDAARGLAEANLVTLGSLPAMVGTAVEQLSAVGKLDEQNFVRWTGEAFGLDLTRARPGNFYDSVFGTFGEQLADLGINRQGLHRWMASSLAADLRLGDASEFRRLLPYPEGVSEQRREDLHRQWVGKIAYGGSDNDVAHVAVHVLARLLSQSVRIYQPFDAPYDIDSGSDSTKLPVVFYDGAYYLVRPADPDDADLAARIAIGPERTPIPEGEKRRLDGLFDQALGVLLTRIAAAEEKLRTTGRHWPVQREVLERKLAVIRQGVGGVDLAERQRPESPRQQADTLTEYRRYLNSIIRVSASGLWRGEDPRPQEGRVTLHSQATSQGESQVAAVVQVGAKRLRIRHLNTVAMPGDRIALDFGVNGEEVFAVARIPYRAPGGTEAIIYGDFPTDFTAEDLNVLNERVVEARWRKVGSALSQLTMRRTRKGSEFKRWAYEVFRIGRADSGGEPLDAFYGTVLKAHGERLAQSGVTTVAGLGVLVARQLGVDLGRGEQSMFRALLPYPEDMSEQRRETLHQHLLNKLVHRRPGYPDVVHVVPHVVAWGLGLPMVIHHPFGAPYVIGPPTEGGEVPQPVVWLNGAYYLVQPRDPHDARIVEGFPSPAALTELRRLDVVFDEALEVLKTEVDTAEQNTAIGHWPLLRDTFHRNVAAIGRRPSSPRGLADVLQEHLRYREALREESTWEDENRWNLQDPFTVPVLVEDIGGRSTLRLRLDGYDTILGYADRVAVPGDRVAVDFGKVDGEGVGIARIPYTAPDGTERFAYQEIARRFTDSELAELWSTAAGPVWETVDRWRFGNLSHITAPVSESGTFDITFGGQRVTLPPVEMADGLPPVVAAELREGRFRLGYGMEGQPLAVLEVPADRNGTGAPLYLELSSPAPTAYDIERLRSMALWESVEPAALLDEVSIDLVMQEDRRTPNPLPITLGDDNSGRTLDGQEVDLSPGTEVALRVGRFFRLEESNVVTSIFAAVKAPLADQSGYAYRLVDTNLSNEWFDEFRTQWETTDSGKRRAVPEWPAGPLEKRPRTGPGGPAASEWAGAASADGGVGSSSEWAAGVKPSVVWVDGGWRVSYRSAEGLPSWGEMTRVES